MQLWSAAGLSNFESLTSKIYEMMEKDIRLGFDTGAQARKLFVREMSVSTIISALCFFPASQAPSLSNSRYVDLHVCASGSIN